jgi:5-methylcytosine-specific restriction protein A
VPTRAALPCRQTGCGQLVPSSGYCASHQKAVYVAQDAHRGTSTERGYNARWRKARATYLQRHPLCVVCMEQHTVTPATVVDHVIPHQGDSTRFWDTMNWQGLCKQHHDSKTARESAFGRG